MMIKNRRIPALASVSKFSVALLRRTGWRFLLLLRSDADLLQERLDRLCAAKELLDGCVDIARIPRLINLATQAQSWLFIEVTILGFFKDGGHIGCDRVRPGITVVTGIVTVQMAKVGNEGR